MAQGNTIEWLNALEMIRQLDAEYLVPGHGPVCDAEATYRIEEYIRFMRGRVRDYYLAGKNKNETKSGLVSEMVEWFPIPPERKAKIESQIKSGLNRVFREIQREGIAHGPNRRQRTFSKRQRRSSSPISPIKTTTTIDPPCVASIVAAALVARPRQP